IKQGLAKTKTKKDGWTVITKDRQLSAQWEHTILVTETGYEVLTLRPEEHLGGGPFPVRSRDNADTDAS
ncbi:MAG: hypothetical protein WEB07_00585, partial [Natronospirillum sp.]